MTPNWAVVRAICWTVLVGFAVFDLYILIDYWIGAAAFAGGLKDWSTMVTGILAVGAALYTVRQMKITEKLQGERHDALMRLNVKSDRLKVQRAAWPHSQSLNVAIWDTDVKLADWKPDADPDTKFIEDVYKRLQEISALVNLSAFVEAAPLFEPSLNFHYDRLKVTAWQLSAAATELQLRFVQSVVQGNNVIRMEGADAAQKLMALKEALTVVRTTASYFTTGLIELADEYERYAPLK